MHASLHPPPCPQRLTLPTPHTIPFPLQGRTLGRGKGDRVWVSSEPGVAPCAQLSVTPPCQRRRWDLPGGQYRPSVQHPIPRFIPSASWNEPKSRVSGCELGDSEPGCSRGCPYLRSPPAGSPGVSWKGLWAACGGARDPASTVSKLCVGCS